MDVRRMDGCSMNRRNASGTAQDVVARVHQALRHVGVDPIAGLALVQLSGGGDSTALLLAMTADRPPGTLRALHVNYGLRAAESDADEDFCRELCARLGVALDVVKAPEHPGGNLQDWARELRYAAAEQAAEKLGEDAVIVVAHTADDQAETILYRLFASPGRRALRGMRPRRGPIVRPLLGLRRAELRDWLAARGEPWREDASNEDPRFARVRARRLLADAEQLHPAAVANLLRTAGELRDEGDELAAVVDDLTARLTTADDELDLDRLAELPPALGGAVLRAYVERRRPVAVPKAAGLLAEALRLGRSGEPRELQVEGARLAIARGRARVIAD
jgi:tRNA(Ile)-lysidine synthase